MKTESRTSLQRQYRPLYDEVQAAGKRISLPYFLGTMGALGEFRFCSLDCLCAERQQGPILRQESLLRLGVKLDTETGRIRRAGLAERSKVIRDARALAELAANLRAPAVPYLCKGASDPLWLQQGRDAFAALCVQADRPHGLALRGERVRMQGWAESCAVAAEYLRELAGTRRMPYSIRLVRAASLFERLTSECFLPILRILAAHKQYREIGDLVQARYLLEDAAQFIKEAVDYVLEAVRFASKLSGTVCGALLLDGPETLSGTQLNELVYLARSGSVPFRQLAAESLARTDQPQAASSLRQLMYDKTENVALAAAAAYKTVRPTSWPASFLRAISHMAGEPAEFREEVVGGLLLNLQQTDDLDRDQVNATLLSVIEAWPKSKLINACAAGLSTRGIRSE